MLCCLTDQSNTRPRMPDDPHTKQRTNFLPVPSHTGMWLIQGDHFNTVPGTRNREPGGEVPHRIAQCLGGSFLQSPTQGATNSERNREDLQFLEIENCSSVPGSDAERRDEVHTEQRPLRSDQSRAGALGVCPAAGCVSRGETGGPQRQAPGPPCGRTVSDAQSPAAESHSGSRATDCKRNRIGKRQGDDQSPSVTCSAKSRTTEVVIVWDRSPVPKRSSRYRCHRVKGILLPSASSR